MRRRVCIIALGIAMVSCGAGNTTGTTAPQATPTATTPQPSDAEPAAEGAYGSVADMMDDVESTFYLCTAPMKVYDPPLDGDALAQADCSQNVSFLIYEPNDVQTKVAEIQSNADGTTALLVGNNWIITCSSEAICERIQGGTGGELIVTTP